MASDSVTITLPRHVWEMVADACAERRQGLFFDADRNRRLDPATFSAGRRRNIERLETALETLAANDAAAGIGAHWR